jgi:hypothetical protein
MKKVSDLIHRWGPYLVQPIVVGLDKGEKEGEWIPIVATYDYIGNYSVSKHY